MVPFHLIRFCTEYMANAVEDRNDMTKVKNKDETTKTFTVWCETKLRNWKVFTTTIWFLGSQQNIFANYSIQILNYSGLFPHPPS